MDTPSRKHFEGKKMRQSECLVEDFPLYMITGCVDRETLREKVQRYLNDYDPSINLDDYEIINIDEYPCGSKILHVMGVRNIPEDDKKSEKSGTSG